MKLIYFLIILFVSLLLYQFYYSMYPLQEGIINRPRINLPKPPILAKPPILTPILAKPPILTPIPILTPTPTPAPTIPPRPTEYDLNNPDNVLILAQQNAGNIANLRDRVDRLDAVDNIYVDDEIAQIKTDMTIMQTQIDSLVKQQSDYAAEIAGGTTPVEISGTEGENDTVIAEETPNF